MALKYLIFFCVQAVLFQTAYSQCVNRVASAASQLLGPIANGQAVYGQNVIAPNFLPINDAILSNLPCGLPPSFEALLPQTYQPTIIQDTSVSNSLANALQLLVVSNLLSNKLPFNGQEVVVPSVLGPVVSEQYIAQPACGCANQFIPAAPTCGCGLGGFNGFFY